MFIISYAYPFIYYSPYVHTLGTDNFINCLGKYLLILWRTSSRRRRSIRQSLLILRRRVHPRSPNLCIKHYYSPPYLLQGLLLFLTQQIDDGCENYAVIPLFSSISPYLCKTSCPRHDIKLHNYASLLLRQHVAHAYGQDTLYWL